MSDKPDPGRELREQKQQMFAEQQKRAERERPLNDRNQAAFARRLLERLETIDGPAPKRIAMPGPPASAFDPLVQKPERIGGCFSDLVDDEPKRNEGAHEKEIDTEIETAIPSEDDEIPFG